jgi:D-tyrosyl-tRNA(Tyr) deacylase
MRAVVQRVARASVAVEGTIVAQIGAGLVVLVAVEAGDDVADAEALVDKLSGLRVFPDGDGRMNRSVLDIGGEALVVSQFTLAADLRRGRRPSFARAADPSSAEPLVDAVASGLVHRGVATSKGSFGAMMAVELVNDGPVTFVIDVRDGSVA